MYLEETLTNWSADVTVLNSGRLLGDKLRDAATRGRPYAVVLLDHSLPDATTEELLRTIRLDPDLCRTYLVLLSASISIRPTRALLRSSRTSVLPSRYPSNC